MHTSPRPRSTSIFSNLVAVFQANPEPRRLITQSLPITGTFKTLTWRSVLWKCRRLTPRLSIAMRTGATCYRIVFDCFLHPHCAWVFSLHSFRQGDTKTNKVSRAGEGAFEYNMLTRQGANAATRTRCTHMTSRRTQRGQTIFHGVTSLVFFLTPGHVVLHSDYAAPTVENQYAHHL